MGTETSIFIMLIIGGLAFLALKAMSEPTPEPKAAPAPMPTPKPDAPELVPPHEVIPDFLDWEVGDVLWEEFTYDYWGQKAFKQVKYVGTNDMFELVLEKEIITKSTSLEYIEEEKHNGYRERISSKTEVQTLSPQDFITQNRKNKRLENIKQQQKWLQEELQKKERERQEQEKQEAIKKSVEDSDYNLRLEFMKQAMKELKNEAP